MMPDVSWGELMVIAVVALVVIGPKDLPNVLRTLGQWVRKARSLASEFQGAIDHMAREAEIEELRKQVQAMRDPELDAQIERTMSETRERMRPPAPVAVADWAATPTPADAADQVESEFDLIPPEEVERQADMEVAAELRAAAPVSVEDWAGSSPSQPMEDEALDAPQSPESLAVANEPPAHATTRTATKTAAPEAQPARPAAPLPAYDDEDEDWDAQSFGARPGAAP
jgi:sec-independent protein translocase protein TatB